ncbi:ABC-2 type transporter-domain-containing protein [Ilyonectria destructans]|nr:ABC-2 type transporter-domain-containing protein [Ilyonectria destructans]
MPGLPQSRPKTSNVAPEIHSEHDGDDASHVFVTSDAQDAVAELHRAITNDLDPALSSLDQYLRDYNRAESHPVSLSVCFKSVTTYGQPGGAKPVKTLRDAIWRTLTLQDIYEWTFKRILRPTKVEEGQALIRDFSGVVRGGEMMLVLGNPGSGCSTFLRTVGNDHSSFLGIKGSIDYSGLSPKTVSERFRGAVSYVPEDDIHLPTLTVRQTLEFALHNRTHKTQLDQVPEFMETFGRTFGMTHAMDTLVGNEFIRGVSGGERKRVSILESLVSDSSVQAWDGSTRGLDASSALDYVKSLRIMTDACQRATLVSLYQASDTIFNLMDKVMLIDQGRMLYQGPAKSAEAYFNTLGYQRLPRQSISDFLTSIVSANTGNIRNGYESSAPRGAIDLERAFRNSQAFEEVQIDIRIYEAALEACFPPSVALEKQAEQRKSKYVSSRSPYTTSFFRQVFLCTKREFWQLKGYKVALISKALCIIVCAFLLSSMFYNMPRDTGGVYSRGGFCFYSAAMVSWFQLAELETAFFDRPVVSRQKRYAIVRPSAVVLGKTLMDIPTIFIQTVIFCLIAYFISGMRRDAASFFTYTTSIFLCAMAFTAFYRTFGSASSRLEVALRHCGILLLLAVACGGYIRPIDSLISDVPWVGWLAYLTPVLYTYEIIMTTEFLNREFACQSNSLIPAGPTYNNSTFQTCASKGTSLGQLSLDGNAYVASEFGFSFSNLGRNFGILILFTIGLSLLNMWLAETVDWASGGGAALEFARSGRELKSTHKSDEETTDELRVNGEVDGDATRVSTSRQEETKLVHSSSIFTWRNLHYKVPHKGGMKQLLKDVSGFCEPSKLTALVGASGAGKSTLLTVLTQQGSGPLTGEMKVGNEKVDSTFGRRVGYCQQMNIHVETSTVREAFEFSALLRQESGTSAQDKLAYVDEVLGVLGMTDVQNVVIRTLSLEQKKRTTIGVELCAKPDLLLFLDEPTSGLDSQGAMRIVRLLRKLADAGQAIVCTIHQASQEQFELFDRVLALNRGGVYYFGDIGDGSKTVLDYFSRHGAAAEPQQNVADFLIQVVARDSERATEDWCDVWSASPEASGVLDMIDQITSTRPNDHQWVKTDLHQQYASSTFVQVLLLTRRTLIQYWRTPDYIYSRLYCSFFHAALNGLLFLQLGNGVAEMQYRIFSCFLVLMIVPEFINACAMMFDENRNVWLGREYPSRIYGWVAFSTAQIVAEIPYALLGSVLFYALFYFLVGLPLGTPAGYTFLMMMLFHLFATSWGQWIAALSADAGMAASIMPFFVVMCEFFNGVLQPQSLMPAVWRYTMYYIGPFTYWISGIVVEMLSGLHVRCKDTELIQFHTPTNSTCGEYAQEWLSNSSGYLADPDATDVCGYCPYSAGEDYLSTINLNTTFAWPCLGIFVLFTITNYLSVFLWVYIKSVKNWLPW